MIVGIGIDAVEVERIKRAVERFGDRFLNKVFCPSELEHCLKKKEPYPGLAARFAAKEALVKALGTGFRQGLGFREICVVIDKFGAPSIALTGNAEQKVLSKKVSKIWVSMTHEAMMAVTVVVLER